MQELLTSLACICAISYYVHMWMNGALAKKIKEEKDKNRHTEAQCIALAMEVDRHKTATSNTMFFTDVGYLQTVLDDIHNRAVPDHTKEMEAMLESYVALHKRMDLIFGAQEQRLQRIERTSTFLLSYLLTNITGAIGWTCTECKTWYATAEEVCSCGHDQKKHLAMVCKSWGGGSLHAEVRRQMFLPEEHVCDDDCEGSECRRRGV